VAEECVVAVCVYLQRHPHCRYLQAPRRWCEYSYDVPLCSLLCCSLGSASALVTFIRVFSFVIAL
jgi:hypothetical protein